MKIFAFFMFKIKISTDDLDSEHCNKTVDVVQETRYNETMYCHESEGRECWSNYQTEVDVIQVKLINIILYLKILLIL